MKVRVRYNSLFFIKNYNKKPSIFEGFVLDIF